MNSLHLKVQQDKARRAFDNAIDFMKIKQDGDNNLAMYCLNRSVTLNNKTIWTIK